jgi:hypothetical protein
MDLNLPGRNSHIKANHHLDDLMVIVAQPPYMHRLSQLSLGRLASI